MAEKFTKEEIESLIYRHYTISYSFFETFSHSRLKSGPVSDPPELSVKRQESLAKAQKTFLRELDIHWKELLFLSALAEFLSEKPDLTQEEYNGCLDYLLTGVQNLLPEVVFLSQYKKQPRR